MAGLLDGFNDFIKTPEGQGLLSATFGGMAGARKGTPWNNMGRAGVAGVMGYGGAMDREAQAAEAEQMKRYRDMQYRQGEMQMGEQQRKMELDQQMRQAAAGAMRSPEMANAMSQGPMPDGGAMPTVQPGFDAQKYTQSLYGIDPLKAMEFERSIAKDDAPVKLGPGEQLFGGRASGYKPLLSVPGKEAELPSSVREYNFAREQGFKGSFVDFQLAQKRAGASSVSVNMTDGQKGFENEMKLGGAFKQEPIYKAHQEVQSAFAQVTAALNSGTPVGDLAGATKIMKILDPGSVVRESELGMAMAAGGRMDRLQNYVKQFMDGTKLTPQQRLDFGALSSELTAASAQAYNSKLKEYQSQGGEFGLNTGRALGKPAEVPSIMKPTAKTSGLSIIAPNGKTYDFNNEAEMKNFKMATGIK